MSCVVCTDQHLLGLGTHLCMDFSVLKSFTRLVQALASESDKPFCGPQVQGLSPGVSVAADAYPAVNGREINRLGVSGGDTAATLMPS